jgi:hypothetical protein
VTPSSTRIGVLPDFLVIGAMKAGTTSLYHYLDAHPDVFMPRVKELDFFVESGNWGRGIEWYRRQFAGADGFAAVGEASTSYSKHPVVAGVPERVARSVPGCRLVYVVRDPIERIASHYRHRWANGSERAAIEDAVTRDPVYLACSRYAAQIGRYLDHFPRERLMVLTAEDLRSDRAGTIAEVFRFLGVDAAFRPEALVEEHYRAESRVTYPPAAWRLRQAVKHRVPAAKRAKEAIDSSSLARRLSRWGGGSAAEGSAQISPALRSRLVDELRDDVVRLRPYLPAGWQGWGIA